VPPGEAHRRTPSPGGTGRDAARNVPGLTIHLPRAHRVARGGPNTSSTTGRGKLSG
jgi:hypothetical protein